MSLTNLQSYIKTTTDQKVEAIIAEAKKEESKIVSEARQKAKKIQNEIKKTKQEELELKERSILAMEELNWKKKILETNCRYAS